MTINPQNSSQLSFYELPSTLEESVKLPESSFSLMIQSPISNFWFASPSKRISSEFSNILVVHTAKNVTIYRQNDRKTFLSAFFISCKSDPKEKPRLLICPEFKALYDIRETTTENYIGILYFKQEGKFHVVLVKNLLINKQTYIDENWEFQIEGFARDRLIDLRIGQNDLELITLKDESILSLNVLRPRNDFHKVFSDSMKILNKEIEIQSASFNYFFNAIYVRLQEDKLAPNLLSYYKKKFLLGSTNNINLDFSRSYNVLFSEKSFLTFLLVEKRVVLCKWVETDNVLRTDCFEVSEFETDIFQRYSEALFMKFFPLSKKKIIVIVETSDAFGMFELFVPTENKIQSFKFLIDLPKESVGHDILDFGLIYSLEKYTSYRVFFLKEKFQITGWHIDESKLTLQNEITFDLPINRISANKKYPYNLVAITKGLELIFMTDRLSIICRYSLSELDQQLSSRSWATSMISYHSYETKNEDQADVSPNNEAVASDTRKSIQPISTNLKEQYQHLDNQSILNSFSFTYLYDDIYHICYKSKQTLFELVLKNNRHFFKQVNLNHFCLRDLNELEPDQSKPLKVLNVNALNACYLRGNSLKFASVKLAPAVEEAKYLPQAAFNFHKYLLLNKYNYQFFTVETLFELLKTNKVGTLYQLIYDSVKFDATEFNARSSLAMSVIESNSSRTIPNDQTFDTPQVSRRGSVNLDLENDLVTTLSREVNRYSFNPVLMLEYLKLNLQSFLEKNSFSSESEFFSTVTDLLEKDTDLSLRRKTVSKLMLDRAEQFSSISNKVDYPAQIFSLELNKLQILQCPSTNEELTNIDLPIERMTSELVFLASITEEQDYVLNQLLSGRPMSISLVKTLCIGSWMEDFDRFRSIIDKAMMLEYKATKKVMGVIFWFVLLGKQKLLSPLFKLEPGQEKFVKFFSENFDREEIREKAINNAFLLKSQKKYDLCAAFFLLARNYVDAIMIIVEELKDLQLAILVLRFFEKEIPIEETRSFFQRHFVEKGRQFNDFFTEAIGLKMMKDYPALLSTVSDAINSKVNLKQDQVFESLVGFTLSGLSVAMFDLFTFMKNSSMFKQYVEVAAQSSDLISFFENRFLVYSEKEQVYLALLAILEIKNQCPDNFQKVVDKHRRKIEQLIMKINYKKLGDLIRKNKVSMLQQQLNNIRVFASNFGIEPERILSKVFQRISLLEDDYINMYALAWNDSEKLVEDLKAEKFTKRCLTACIKLLKRDPLSQFPLIRWLRYIALTFDGSELVQRLQQNGYEPSPKLTVLLSLLAFLLLIYSSSYEEALAFIEHSQALKPTNNAFISLLYTAKQKIKLRIERYRKETEGETKPMGTENGYSGIKRAYSPTNTLVSIFFRYMFLNNFISADSYDEMVRSRVTDLEPTFPLLLDECKENLKFAFFELLQQLSFDSQGEIIKEMQILFFEKSSSLKKRTFVQFNAFDALCLGENVNVISEAISCSFYSRLLEEFRLAQLLSIPLRDVPEQYRQSRKAFFGIGIEIARLKLDHAVHTKSRLTIPTPPAIHLYSQNKLRRISIFESLMKRPRVREGLSLASEEDPASISSTLEFNEVVNQNELRDKPLVLRILFKFFFERAFSLTSPKKLLKLLESIIDNQTHALRNIQSLTDIKYRPNVPLIYATQGSSFFVLNPKSTATLFESPISQSLLTKLEIDKFGEKALLIDTRKNAFLVFYRKTRNVMETLRSFEGSYYSGAITDNSCGVLLTSNSSKIVFYDILNRQEEHIDLASSSAERCRVLHAPNMNNFIFINKRKCSVSLVDDKSFSLLSTIEVKSDTKVRTYAYHPPSKTLVLGLKNGLVCVVDLVHERVIEEKALIDWEGKSVKIDSLAILDGFVVVSGANGIVSLFLKL